MRVAVTGASGNVGSALLRELGSRGHDVIAVARRVPDGLQDVEDADIASVRWHAADVGRDNLDPALEGCDALVHLAWMFQPTHDPDRTWEANAVGTRRALHSAARSRVPIVISASSIAAYSPAVDDEPVDETWPTDGPSSAAYCREKAYAERLLDALEAERPDLRVVRMRPAFVFQRSAASEQRRIFGAPALRPWMLDRRFIPAVPVPQGLRLQAVHTGDLARAYAQALERPVHGAFNIAADDVLRREDLGRILDARTAEVPRRLVRAAVEAAWRARLVGAPGDLYDALMRLPVMSTARAKEELGWQPQHSAADALEAMISGARSGAGSGMPPLHPDPTFP
ncbi:NAD-dependent epimerase/dehydratase family protein [Mumia zhuanghuii]|uniref:NAD-dependent epimerase/dehydratase family protein n=2 Tax=Mumia TaxID=1546255 RepID=A0ABW1QIC7_9ACTN|nr:MULTISPECIES: NAD-dependent epimerase/dehydratase family protein [Mumia]KAA1425313.1 NAD-dependent epimerase/dehydratase family protein [Mumia zhuanghuii]